VTTIQEVEITLYEVEDVYEQSIIHIATSETIIYIIVEETSYEAAQDEDFESESESESESEISSIEQDFQQKFPRVSPSSSKKLSNKKRA
jgi:hypothetical protein